MDYDRELFQETAQKLIDYDSENKDSYQWGQDDIKKGSRRFYAYQIVLIIIISLDVYNLARGVSIGIFDNILFLVIFAVSYSKYRDKVRKKEEVLEKRMEILNNEERVKCKNILDQLAQKHPEWKVEAWWDIGGLELGIEKSYSWYHLYYFDLPLVKENEKGKKYIGKENCMANIETGEKVISLIRSGNYHRFIVNAMTYQPNQKYEIAALYLHAAYENERVYERNTYSPEAISDMMGEYRENLDEKERNRNFWGDFEIGRFETDAEKHWRSQFEGNYDWHQEVDDWFTRSQKEEKRRCDLENDITQVKYVESYHQTFYHVGWLVFNGNLSEVLINKGCAPFVHYDTTSETLGEHCLVKRERAVDAEKDNIAMPTIEVISKLNYLELYTMDYTSKRPVGLTLKEWAAWIYAHST